MEKFDPVAMRFQLPAGRCERVRYIARGKPSSSLRLRLYVARGDFHRRSRRGDSTAPKPHDFVAQFSDPGGIVGDEHDGDTGGPECVHTLDASLLK